MIGLPASAKQMRHGPVEVLDMVNRTHGSLNVVAIYLRHYRACLSVFWTLTLALATFALSGFPQSASNIGTPAAMNARSRQAACTDGRILVHVVTSGTTECIRIVWAHK
jgi:hypothetical protein